MVDIFGVIAPRELLTEDEQIALVNVQKWHTVHHSPTVRIARNRAGVVCLRAPRFHLLSPIVLGLPQLLALLTS